MFKISVKLTETILNVQKYSDTLKLDLAENITRAAFEYVLAATSVIPVWSGASQATFTELANAIGLPLTISPVVQSREFLGQGFSSGDLDTSGTTVSFVYETNLPHLIFNEYNDGNSSRGPGQFGTLLNPGPYGFQAIARGPAEAITSAFVGPNINLFIKKKKLNRRIF
jgi:hypothetical protein